ncbi:MAG: type II toxin-antitoxin system RelE/ParE family toxin [Leptospiraceae bacterium]|nr:type II toxin-antitoxin system RelE/ParE family toxin [Leptospiraceae bacterium]
MAQKIIWSQRSLNEFNEILEYWTKKNQSDTYSKKLATQIIKSVDKIGKFIYIGKETEDEKARVYLSGNYSIFYEIAKEEIVILCLWDNRRNPDTLNLF